MIHEFNYGARPGKVLERRTQTLLTVVNQYHYFTIPVSLSKTFFDADFQSYKCFLKTEFDLLTTYLLYNF